MAEVTLGGALQNMIQHTDMTALGVLVVGPLHPPPLTGGIEMQIQYLLESDLVGRLGIRLFNTTRRDDPSRRLGEKLRYQLRSCSRFVATLRRDRPRVVQIMTASYLNFFQSAVYALIARCHGTKVLLYIHGGGFKEFFAGAGVAGRVLIRASLKLPHALLATSTGWATYFQDVSPGQRVRVVPNGLPVNAYAHADADRARFGIGSDRIAVLFMGGRNQQILREKGFPELAQAIGVARRTCPALMLVAAGPVCDTELLTKVLGPEGGSWVAVGPVWGGTKTRLFRSVDVFALPSRIENMPNTVMEAMAAGLPVIATPVGAIPEMIEHARSGFIVQLDDVQDLAAKLVTLGVDGELRTTMGAHSLTLARRSFDFGATKERLLKEYRRLGAVEPHVTQNDCRGFEADAGTPKAAYVWYRRPAVQRPLHKLGRILHMGPAELAHRLRRLVATPKARPRAELNRQSAAKAPPFGDQVSGNTAQYVKDRTIRGFFDLDQRESTAALVRARVPGETERTILSADALLSTGIELLGKHFQPAAEDVDWLADPDHGRLWPLAVMDDADVVTKGVDVKFVWELNRHQYLATLGRAYTYTGDERYAVACVRIVRSWVSANPCPLGVNWSSNLEVAIRSISWLWCIQFVVGCGVLGEDDLRLWFGSLREHFDHVATHLSTYTDPTNHLIGEAAALALIAIWCPEWDPQARRRNLALAILEREAGRQVEADGVDKEQSTSYQRFVLDLFLQVMALADRNDVTTPDTLRTRVSGMLAAIHIMIGPAGRAPRIGDSDDARGVPFFTADPWDFRELLALGRAVLGTSVPADQHGADFESSLWIGGGAMGGRDASSAGGARGSSHSTILPLGGYASMWSHRPEARDRLLFDCGPLGYLPNASHGHADLLSILVEVDGEELLVDPGTFAYHDQQGRRDSFRATRSHNTIEIGGRDQADAVHPFKWVNTPKQGIEVQYVGDDVDYVEAWHDGYKRIKPSVRHRRGILTLDGGWLVIDWLEGKGHQRFARWFHAAPTATLAQLDAARVRISGSGRNTLLVTNICGASEEAPSVLEAGVMPYSERYGRSVPAPAFRYLDVAALPALRLTLLVPGSEFERGARQNLQCVSVHTAPTGGGIGLLLCDASERQWQVALRGLGAEARVGSVDTGARIVIAELFADGRPPSVVSF